MKRITKPGYKFTLLNVLSGLARYADVDEVLNLLAAYEDTGLMPKEVVPVVRCKDCRHYRKPVVSRDSGICVFACRNRLIGHDDYCSHAERREDTPCEK